MNIFFLHEDTKLSAQYHCDKHQSKMIIEYAQLLSTAHRYLDGTEYIDSSSGRRIRRWKLNDGREDVLYKATHLNHPSAVWARESVNNYYYLYNLYHDLCDEFTYRYNKDHKTMELREALVVAPKNIPDVPMTPVKCAITNLERKPVVPLAEAVEVYRTFYQTKQDRFAMKWSKRPTPEWFHEKTL